MTENSMASILLLHDRLQGLVPLRGQLEAQGYTVQAVEDAEAAFKAALSQAHDLVVVDMAIPSFDGYKLCRRLKNSSTTAETPILILTRSEMPTAAKERALGAGADDFLVQPYDRADLLARIRSLLRISELNRRAEESDARYQSVVENLPIVVYTAATDEAGTRLYISPQIETVLGYTQRDFEVDPDLWVKRLHPDDSARVLADLSCTRENGAPFLNEYRMIARDERVVWVRDRAACEFDNAGALLRAQGAMADITAEKEAEEALCVKEEHLQRAQKIEAIGLLAGGVAHDFRNLLTIIEMSSDMLLQELPQGSKVSRYASDILEAATRGANLTNQLLAFARRELARPKVLNLNDIVSEMQCLLERLLGEDIELILRLSSDLGNIFVDRAQIEQVLINLAVNARDAMPQGGKLFIETANAELDDAFVQSHGFASADASARPGPYVSLSVTDAGQGTDRETQSHVFEPFFTTKEPGLGTGLGLAMVHAIVEQHHGCITVDTDPGTGSAFKIYFPRTFEPVRDVSGPPAAEAPGGCETLLLAEDEDSLRTLARHILEGKGYTVLEARSGPEALELYARQTRPVDLVITDVVMPEMGGRELVGRLTDRHPGLKAMYMSAYPEDTLLRKGVEAGTVNFLSKPFSPQELIGRVHEALTEQSLAAVDLDGARDTILQARVAVPARTARVC